MKKIIIIGASSGIGAAVATDFAAAGWHVGIAARRLDRLDEIKAKYPDRIVTHAIDVTSPDAVGRFRALIEMNGGMDVFLYASGVGFRDPDLDEGNLVNTLEVNIMGFARLVADAYKYFRDNADITIGRIAAITSVAGTKGIGVSAAYSASKRFQQTFLESLDQLARSRQVNVRITDIRPGFVRTSLLRSDRSYPMIMTVPYAARCIEKAILSGKRVAYIDWRWGLLTGVWRMMPSWLWVRMPVDF